jgi:hypothetical protein
VRAGSVHHTAGIIRPRPRADYIAPWQPKSTEEWVRHACIGNDWNATRSVLSTSLPLSPPPLPLPLPPSLFLGLPPSVSLPHAPSLPRYGSPVGCWWRACCVKSRPVHAVVHAVQLFKQGCLLTAPSLVGWMVGRCIPRLRYDRFYFREYTPCFNDVVIVSGIHLTFFIVCGIRYVFSITHTGGGGGVLCCFLGICSLSLFLLDSCSGRGGSGAGVLQRRSGSSFGVSPSPSIAIPVVFSPHLFYNLPPRPFRSPIPFVSFFSLSSPVTVFLLGGFFWRSHCSNDRVPQAVPAPR